MMLKQRTICLLILALLIAAPRLSRSDIDAVTPPAAAPSGPHLGAGAGNVPGVSGPPPTGGNTNVGVDSRFAAASPVSVARDLSQSPLFALASGLASIIGLLVALYATQVRTIPFSLYRSFMWRKALFLANGTGLLVFGSMKFYMQDEAPFIEPLRDLHVLLLGVLRVSASDLQAHGPSVWPVVVVVGLLFLTAGLRYDPAARARIVLVREQQALQNAQAQQLSLVLRGRRAEDLSAPDRRVFDDTLEYYRHVQWRFADVVLGAPPPTFPLFHPDRLRNSRANDV